MGLFSKFKKKDESSKIERNATIKVSKNEKLTENGSRIHFDIPENQKAHFKFEPGQYVSIHTVIDGEKLNRSYSICSGPNEPLAIGVKAIENGRVSNYLVNTVKEGDELIVDFPKGHFTIKESDKQIVCFAAGSGITPIMSIAKHLTSAQTMHLFYGNTTRKNSFFLDELMSLPSVKPHLLFSQEVVENALSGRLDKQHVSDIIKADLSLLRADGFYICGPEAMILSIQEVLHLFGIPKEKIHFELFTTPVLMKQETPESTVEFKGEATVTAILDGDVTTIKLNAQGKTILDALDKAGMDVPFSCKGGVCCTCKAKIIEGSAKMMINYALTDDEVKDGYILTCQSHPTSEVLKIDFDV